MGPFLFLLIFVHMQGLDINKQYRYAKSLVGDDFEDLVHLSYIRYAEYAKTRVIKHPNSYFYRIMLGQLQEGQDFAKKYRGHDLPLLDIHQALEDKGDKMYDISLIRQIISDLIREGYREEIELFIYLANGGKQCTVYNSVGVHRKELKKIYTFIKNQIISRYVHS